MRWLARTRPLEAIPDLLAEAGEDGVLWRGERGGLACVGEAFRIELAGGLADPSSVGAVGSALSAIETDDAVGLPGCGPVAIGALPFDPHAAGSLTVPRRIVGRAGDRAWETAVVPVGDVPPAGGLVAPDGGGPVGGGPVGGAPVGTPPDRFTLESTMSHEEWQGVVADAVAVVEAGELEKVVLARRVDIAANRDFIISDVLERLIALYPSCMVFHVGTFIGASPELLVRRDGELVESHPLAGTVARSGDTAADAALAAGLMASPKIRHEHQVVIDALRDSLAPICDVLDVPSEPSILGLRNVSHLATHLRGRLTPLDGAPLPTALELAARLHPTPAVGGTPTDAAIEYLQKVEGFDRGFYGGPVGWVDARGDGAWAVGIRCADVSGSTAQLYAGNGIVGASVPPDELRETQLKLQALLAALVRP